MLIVGERLNSTARSVAAAIAARDLAFMQQAAQAQVAAGAGYLDLNAAAGMAREPEDLVWLVEVVQDCVQVPLCIDSPNPAALAAGLAACRQPAMVNSTTAEPERAAVVIPLAARHGARLVALTMDDAGMPTTAQGRLQIAQRLVALAGEAGIQPEHLYLDPLVRPVGAEADQGQAFLEGIGAIREALPRVHLICGLSNVSYGLPGRKLLNRTFLAMAMARGLDAAIVDPLDGQLMATVYAAAALLGQDEFCLQYLGAHRAGRLETA